MRLTYLWALLFALSTVLLGCGDGTSEDSPASSNTASKGTGSVAVLMTDAPIDDFDHFWLTVTEISLLSDDGKVSIFSGSERLDLLDLNSHSDLFALADNIPAGHYDKIRMRVSKPLLVSLHDDGTVDKSIVPKMSGNGKLDLKPSSDLVVVHGEMLALQIDLDADKSIHLIQQGNGAYRFRPVIFIDVISDKVSGKLVRVAGVIDDVENDHFKLCRTGMRIESHDDSRESESTHESDHDAEDDSEHESEHHESHPNEDDHERCVTVNRSDNTTYFNANGEVLDPVTLVEGAPATVLGYFRTRTNHTISLDAQVVEFGPADTFQQYAGVVDELDLANNTFILRDSSDHLFTVSFDDASKFFAMNGELLSVADLELGSSVKVDGVLHSAENMIKAAAIFIDTTAPVSNVTHQLSGTISLLYDDMSGFEIVDESQIITNICVRLGAESNIYLLTTLVDGSFNSEAVGIAALQTSQYVEVYGAFNQPSGCFMADNILAGAP